MLKVKSLKPGWRRVKFGDVVRLSKARSQDPLADGIERYVGLEHLEPGDLRIRSWGKRPAVPPVVPMKAYRYCGFWLEAGMASRAERAAFWREQVEGCRESGQTQAAYCAERRAAAIQSLLGTARLNGIEPLAWLKDTLEKFPTRPNRRMPLRGEQHKAF